jgi:2',3'-cyclic-nucleotide 2'-phosphodiesterase (5'-nucleotidase family)
MVRRFLVHPSWSAAFLLAAALSSMSTTARAVPVTVVGTSDLHGRIERTAALAGHLKLLRASLARSNGGVVLVDAGDMFQGTLESNLGEGRSVVDVYGALRYDAVAIGNHEFDFGPEGPAATPGGPEDDARGALKARARQARFPFLAANTIDDSTGQPVAWPNFRPTTMVTVGRGRDAARVGIIGVTTIDTPKTTIAGNVRGLRFAPLSETVLREATALRAAGAHVVVVAAHAGGKCAEDAVGEPFSDLSTCDGDAEIFRLARALPAGLVDVIVAGHTHQGLSRAVGGIPVVQAWANGRGFSRVDLDVDVRRGTVKLVSQHAPRRVCGPKANDDAAIDACAPDRYDAGNGAADVVVDAPLLKRMAPALRQARALQTKLLGVVIDDEIRRGYDRESALGNLFADLMRASMPGAEVALMNGGGIRSNLPAGTLTYGAVFEMMPFDNRFATARLTGAELRRVFERNLSATKKGGLLSVSGLSLRTACEGGQARVTMVRDDGRVVTDEDALVVVTTDFVALGGDGGLGVAEDRVLLDEGDPVREHLARALQRRGGRIGSAATFDPRAPRMQTNGQSDARCGAPAPAPPTTPPTTTPATTPTTPPTTTPATTPATAPNMPATTSANPG